MLANSDGIATYCINSYFLYTTLHTLCNKKFTKKKRRLTPLIISWLYGQQTIKILIQMDHVARPISDSPIF